MAERSGRNSGRNNERNSGRETGRRENLPAGKGAEAPGILLYLQKYLERDVPNMTDILFGRVILMGEHIALKIWNTEITVTMEPENEGSRAFLTCCSRNGLWPGMVWEPCEKRPDVCRVTRIRWLVPRKPTDETDPFMSRMDSMEKLMADSIPEELVADALIHFLHPDTVHVPANQKKYRTPEEMALRVASYWNSYKDCQAVTSWLALQLQIESREHLSPSRKRQIAGAKDMVLSIDWRNRKPAERAMTIAQAAELLNSRLYGMEEAKTRLLEILAEIRHTGRLPAKPILLEGPPGTGKTELARLAAEILSLPFIEFNLNQENDSVAVTGSSGIYENATYGTFLGELARAGTRNVLIFLDEYDQGFHPGHNGELSVGLAFRKAVEGNGFHELYLDMIIPTDGMLFIAACNHPEMLPDAERDRFQIISVSGYSREEKLKIEKGYILPKMLKCKAIDPQLFRMSGAAYQALVDGYCPEPGIRGLEKMTEQLCGRYLMEVESDLLPKDVVHTITPERLRDVLGLPRVDILLMEPEAGQVNTGFLHSGSLVRTTLECRIAEGTGRFLVLNAPGKSVREDCRVAYEAARLSLGMNFAALDVVLSFSSRREVWDDGENSVGIAAFAAIASAAAAMFGEEEAEYDSTTLFLGGMDLLGNCYIHQSYRLPDLLNSAYESGIRTLVTGFSHNLAGLDTPENLRIISAPKIMQLLSLAPRALGDGAA